MPSTQPSATSLRVLYVGADRIGSGSATGQTLAAIYGSLRAEQVMQLCERVPADVGEATVWPTRGAVLRLLAILRDGGTPRSGSVADGFNASIVRSAPGWRTRLRCEVQALIEAAPAPLPRRVLARLRAWRPDVVHTPLGGIRVPRIALHVARALDVPIVPHFLDDWPSTLYSGGELGGLARRTSLRVLADVLTRSPAILTIGDAMAAEYRTRFGKDCVVAGNAVASDACRGEDGACTADATPARAPGAPFELVYAGGLHLGRAEVLRSVARVLAQVASPWRLVVHAPARDVALLLGRDLPPQLVVGADLRPHEVPARLRAASALLFVESLRPEVAAFTRLSVSTKVPLYVASGRPIVAVGPRAQASVAVLAEHAAPVLVAHGAGAAELAPLPAFLGAVEHSTDLTRRVLAPQFRRDVVQERFVATLVAAARSSRTRDAAC